MSWLALTGIQLGDSIYRFPYFIILGGVLVHWRDRQRHWRRYRPYAQVQYRCHPCSED
jgi:hypothetical protein